MLFWCAGAFDEESERELWLKKIEHACIRSIDHLSCLAQEQEILAMMMRRKDDDPDEETMASERALQSSVANFPPLSIAAKSPKTTTIHFDYLFMLFWHDEALSIS